MLRCVRNSKIGLWIIIGWFLADLKPVPWGLKYFLDFEDAVDLVEQFAPDIGDDLFWFSISTEAVGEDLGQQIEDPGGHRWQVISSDAGEAVGKGCPAFERAENGGACNVLATGFEHALAQASDLVNRLSSVSSYFSTVGEIHR